MRDLLVTLLLFASVVWLIPYPGLIWVSGVVWVFVWFALPATTKRSPKGPQNSRSEKASSAMQQ